MEAAYRGEMMTPSRCGRMDQCVAMGSGSIGLMSFDVQGCQLRVLPCREPLHFVVADLKASKDTVVILKALNGCFPLPADSVQSRMHRYVSNNQVPTPPSTIPTSIHPLPPIHASTHPFATPGHDPLYTLTLVYSHHTLRSLLIHHIIRFSWTSETVLDGCGCCGDRQRLLLGIRHDGRTASIQPVCHRELSRAIDGPKTARGHEQSSVTLPNPNPNPTISNPNPAANVDRNMTRSLLNPALLTQPS